MMPRFKIQKKIDVTLPLVLSDNIRTLLWPMVLKKNRRRESIIKHSGVPQRDYISTHLCNIFMQYFFAQVDKRPQNFLETHIYGQSSWIDEEQRGTATISGR